MIGERTFTNKTRTEDIACIVYARLGFSVDLIAHRTGLSKGAVNYRLKILGIKVTDYRNGKTDLSQRILTAAQADSKKLIIDIRRAMAIKYPATAQIPAKTGVEAGPIGGGIGTQQSYPYENSQS